MMRLCNRAEEKFLVQSHTHTLFFIPFHDNTHTGIGIGTVFAALITGYARNPSLKTQMFSYAILGFALAEAMGLFCLMIAFLLLFAF